MGPRPLLPDELRIIIIFRPRLYKYTYNHILVVKIIMKTKNSIYPTHVFHCHQAISSIFVKRHLNNHFPPYSFDLIDNITWCRYRNVMKTCDGTHSIGASLHNGSYWVHKVRFSHLETNLNQEIAPFFGDYFLLFFLILVILLQSLWHTQIWKIISNDGEVIGQKWKICIYRTWNFKLFKLFISILISK